ncbi:hypothetical protein O7607_30255 [Micromonospora sp. WMMA1949]|uniref:hypothetical protein n=1 Tax=Micromonospora sp. WMMA1949 TaxID=3015162 RepID=UPI0022B6EB97|nr:hypothetical protein [Micromonospora sp. WMMA1949]MCZ7430054.1 hypothetical protein [Micromonospora sp. WMMA1949]
MQLVIDSMTAEWDLLPQRRPATHDQYNQTDTFDQIKDIFEPQRGPVPYDRCNTAGA